MFKIIGFMLIGATLMTAGAFQWGAARKDELKTYTALPGRETGPLKFDTYSAPFKWVDHVAGQPQNGNGSALVQIKPRDGRIEVCGAHWARKRITPMDERAQVWLRTAFLYFKDIRIPTDFLEIEVEGESVIADDSMEAMKLRCVLAEAKWHSRYAEMDPRVLHIVGPAVPPKQ